MARMARIVANNIPPHVTQRGNGRQFLLETDAERGACLELPRGSLQLYPLKLLGYSNKGGRPRTRVSGDGQQEFAFEN
jgi:hypothetical protein